MFALCADLPSTTYLIFWALKTGRPGRVKLLVKLLDIVPGRPDADDGGRVHTSSHRLARRHPAAGSAARSFEGRSACPTWLRCSNTWRHFSGLMGLQLTEAAADRVCATMLVRPDLCTVGGTLHGGAIMAFADAGRGGHVHEPAPGARTTTVDSSTVHRRRAAGQHGHRRVHGVSPRPHDAGLADAGAHRCRQALRRRHADPTRDPG